MARKGRQRAAATPEVDVAARNVAQAHALLANHPIFSPLLYTTSLVRSEGNLCPRDGWAVGAHAHI